MFIVSLKFESVVLAKRRAPLLIVWEAFRVAIISGIKEKV